MDTGRLHAKVFRPAIGSVLLACFAAFPAPADDNVQVVPLFADGRGNQAWVEIVSTGDRMKATPYVGGDGLKKLLENPHENGALAVPVPRLMRLFERARQALEKLKRPSEAPADCGGATVATQPAGRAKDPLESPSNRPESAPSPAVAPSQSPPGEALVNTATR